MKRIFTNEWSGWEQNSSPMLSQLVQCAAYNPLRKTIGMPVGNLISVLEHDKSGSYQMKVFLRADEIRAVGQHVIDAMMCPKYLAAIAKSKERTEKQLVAEVEKILGKTYAIGGVMKAFNGLWKLYDEYHETAWMVEPLQFQAEHILTKYLDDADKLTILLNADEESYSVDILRSLRDCKAGIITPEQHAKKFHWCKNNYFETKMLSASDVIAEIAEHDIAYYDDLLKSISESKQSTIKQKQEIMATLPHYYQSIVRLACEYGAKFCDDRKKMTMMANAAFDKLLFVVAQKTKTSIHDVRMLLPHELEYFINNPTRYVDRFVERRKMMLCTKSFFPILDEIIDQDGQIKPMTEPFIAEGHVAELALAQLNKRLNIFKSDDAEAKLKGTVAYKGEDEVTGVVRIITDPRKEKLNDGEILVATSTTPDFLSAMVKCSAIIVDYGGQTSHAAIVSRELKKPCIIGTNYASSVLQTGSVVKINFRDGTIEEVKS